jgi:DNA-binding NarL/FixJ family response regulator
MRPISVLLVDDNPAFLRIAARLLEAHDDVVVVGAVCGSEEALAQTEDLQPDIILIDIYMPNPGWEIIPRLRAVVPKVGIIALTLIGTDGYRQAVMEAGADDFVPKVAMGTDLLPAIQRVMQASRPWENTVSAGKARTLTRPTS